MRQAETAVAEGCAITAPDSAGASMDIMATLARKSHGRSSGKKSRIYDD